MYFILFLKVFYFNILTGTSLVGYSDAHLYSQFLGRLRWED
jgi:hypothetical protein